MCVVVAYGWAGVTLKQMTFSTAGFDRYAKTTKRAVVPFLPV